MTGSQVKEFARLYGKAFGVRYVTKSVLLRVLGWALRRVPMKYTKYLPKLTDALRPMALVKVVFLTFDLGSSDASLLWQLRVLVHEVVHCMRIRAWKKAGGKIVGWYKEYYTNPTFRAVEEALACAADAEVMYALTGQRPGPPDLASYYVTAEAVEAAAKAYTQHMDSLKDLGRGGATFPEVEEAFVIMKRVGIL